MKFYTIHLRQNEHDRDIILVVEGFCWGAFILSIIWTLWHRMWWVALGLVSVSLIVNGIIYVLGMDALATYILGIGMMVLYGLLGNDLRRWSLANVGFVESGVALGDNQDKALAQFLNSAPDFTKEDY